MRQKRTPKESHDHAIEPEESGEPEGDPRATSKNHVGFSRRKFLLAGTGAAAAAVITARKSWATPQHDGQGKGKGKAKQPAPVSLPIFPQPIVISSYGGQLNGTLSVDMLPGQQIRAYNGNVPGPTFKVKAGDQLNILLDNQLGPNPGGSLDFCGQPNEMSNPHCFNTTNLHTHGLHVSPLSIYGNGNNNPPTQASDDVLVDVKPKTQQQYCIQLPSFHAPGTHWYHAHKHGSAALQLANGLCGALIVEEPDDQKILKVGHKDYVWLIQEVLQNADAQLIYTTPAPASNFLVNGQLSPQLTMLSGEIQRWRFINGTGTPRGLCQLQLLSATGNQQIMKLIAMDGISFYGKAPQSVTEINMGAGNRADVLVQLTAGTYKLVRNNYPWGGGGSATQVLATITVASTTVDMKMPDVIPGTRPAYLQPITTVDPTPTTVMFAALQPGTTTPAPQSPAWANSVCKSFPQPPTHPTNIPFKPPPPSTANLQPGLNVVNCKEYTPPPAPNAPPGDWDMFKPKLNSAQRWLLSNGGGSTHPFHVHVNPFQVEGWKIDPSGPDDPTNWMWLDTVPILLPGPNDPPPPPWFQNKQVAIRTRFLTYYGRYVLHCHILVHEDLGLMANINVIDDGTGIGPCVKV
ncbi:MAG TPA: multicopper oxidase domain-containing protein [Pyrinomonadaceae bacterium]|jgi:FtsP/CotA-like multicopper oxidase with cupredoxin domain